jgi:hypothetical protein
MVRMGAIEEEVKVEVPAAVVAGAGVGASARGAAVTGGAAGMGSAEIITGGREATIAEGVGAVAMQACIGAADAGEDLG